MLPNSRKILGAFLQRSYSLTCMCQCATKENSYVLYMRYPTNPTVKLGKDEKAAHIVEFCTPENTLLLQVTWLLHFLLLFSPKPSDISCSEDSTLRSQEITATRTTHRQYGGQLSFHFLESSHLEMFV